MIEALPPVQHVHTPDVDAIHINPDFIITRRPTMYFGSIVVSEEQGHSFPAAGRITQGDKHIVVPEPFRAPLVLHLEKSKGKEGVIEGLVYAAAYVALHGYMHKKRGVVGLTYGRIARLAQLVGFDSADITWYDPDDNMVRRIADAPSTNGVRVRKDYEGLDDRLAMVHMSSVRFVDTFCPSRYRPRRYIS